MSHEESVLDEVMSQLDDQRMRVRWSDKVAPEHAAQVEELRKAWQDGRLGTKRRTAARAIAKILQSRKIATIGVQGVDEWLARA